MARFSLLGVILALALAVIGGASSAAAQQSTASLTVHFRICPEIPADGDYYGTCHDNGSGANSYIEILTPEFAGTGTTGTTDASGNITFNLDAGSYRVWGPPGDFLDATAVFCSQNSAPSVAIDYPVQLGAGSAVTCDFYVVPSCAAADGDCTPDTTPPPSNDDDDADSGGSVVTLPNTGAGASLNTASAGWHLPLAALAAALALSAAFTTRRARRS